MIREWLTGLVTPFPAPARRMGYLYEQIAIRARHRRHRAAWTPHLAACRELTLHAAERCPHHDLAVIAGAGICLDVPVAELAKCFRRVVLIDVGFLDRPTGVEHRIYDVTGGLVPWHDRPDQDDVSALAAATPPAWPADLPPPDLTVSANLIGQLHLLPATWLERRRHRGEDFRERLGARLATGHLDWLRARPGLRLLIGDVAEIALDRHGAVADEQPTVTAGLDLRAPDRTWDWDISPIPEWDPDHHLRHRVGAWIDP